MALDNVGDPIYDHSVYGFRTNTNAWGFNDAGDKLVYAANSDYTRPAKKITTLGNLEYCGDSEQSFDYNASSSVLSIYSNFNEREEDLSMSLLVNGEKKIDENIGVGAIVSKSLDVSTQSALVLSYITKDLLGCEYTGIIDEYPLKQYSLSVENDSFSIAWNKGTNTTVNVEYDSMLSESKWYIDGQDTGLVGQNVSISNNVFRSFTENNHAEVSVKILDNVVSIATVAVDNSPRSIYQSVSYIINGYSMYAVVTDSISSTDEYILARYIDGELYAGVENGQFEIEESMFGKELKVDMIDANADINDYSASDIYATHALTLIDESDVLYLSSGFYTVDETTVSGSSKSVTFEIQSDINASDIVGYEPVKPPIECISVMQHMSQDISENNGIYTVDEKQYDTRNLVEKNVSYIDAEDTYIYTDESVFTTGLSAFDVIDNIEILDGNIVKVSDAETGLCYKTFDVGHNIVAIDFIATTSSIIDGKELKVSVFSDLGVELFSFSYSQTATNTKIRNGSETRYSISPVYSERVHFALANIGDVRRVQIESNSDFKIEALIVTFRK